MGLTEGLVEYKHFVSLAAISGFTKNEYNKKKKNQNSYLHKYLQKKKEKEKSTTKMWKIFIKSQRRQIRGTHFPIFE